MTDKALVDQLNKILYDIDALAIEAKKAIGDRVSREELAWVEDIRSALYSRVEPTLYRTISLIKDGPDA